VRKTNEDVAVDGEAGVVPVVETLRMSAVVAGPKPKRPQSRRSGVENADEGVEVPQTDLRTAQDS
jgi:hypothetical protein